MVMKKIRIFLVDDHRLIRESLRSLLESNSHIEVVGETGNAFEVVELVQKTSPQIVCMDIGMPDINGIEITKLLLASLPNLKIIALSSYASQRYVKDMMTAGAHAYVTKAAAADELLRAISDVCEGRKYLSPDIT